MMMGLRLIGNDIELDGEKVARLFDILPSTRQRLKEMIEDEKALSTQDLLNMIQEKIEGNENHAK
jgi:DNA-directed RNA polymerase subunit F|tara:strand:+ start:891 stop:1085 length:195 start_codon:yes stop_codon:yes gene_type:complete